MGLFGSFFFSFFSSEDGGWLVVISLSSLLLLFSFCGCLFKKLRCQGTGPEKENLCGMLNVEVTKKEK